MWSDKPKYLWDKPNRFFISWYLHVNRLEGMVSYTMLFRDPKVHITPPLAWLIRTNPRGL